VITRGKVDGQAGPVKASPECCTWFSSVLLKHPHHGAKQTHELRVLVGAVGDQPEMFLGELLKGKFSFASSNHRLVSCVELNIRIGRPTNGHLNITFSNDQAERLAIYLHEGGQIQVRMSQSLKRRAHGNCNGSKVAWFLESGIRFKSRTKHGQLEENRSRFFTHFGQGINGYVELFLAPFDQAVFQKLLKAAAQEVRRNSGKPRLKI